MSLMKRKKLMDNLIRDYYSCGFLRTYGKFESVSLYQMYIIRRNVGNVQSIVLFIIFGRSNNFLPRFYFSQSLIISPKIWISLNLMIMINTFKFEMSSNLTTILSLPLTLIRIQWDYKEVMRIVYQMR